MLNFHFNIVLKWPQFPVHPSVHYSSYAQVHFVIKNMLTDVKYGDHSSELINILKVGSFFRPRKCIIKNVVFFAVVRRKTIYEYHRVYFNRQDIKNWTVIYLKALPTCLGMDNCRDCLTKVPEFDCKWCKELNQCSTGTFRSRQDWLTKGCDIKNIKEPDNCPLATTSYKENNDGYEHEGSVVTGDAMLVARSNSNSLQVKGPDTSPLEHCKDIV